MELPNLEELEYDLVNESTLSEDFELLPQSVRRTINREKSILYVTHDEFSLLGGRWIPG